MEIKTNFIELHIYRRKKKKIQALLLKRGENQIYPGHWQPVTGKIKPGESAIQAAMRELKEETGLDPITIRVVPLVNSFYSPDDDAINIFPVFLAEIDASAKVILSDEHCDYQWTSLRKAKSLVMWPAQRKSISQIKDMIE